MRISVLQENFVLALGMVRKIVENKPAMPIGETILLRTYDGQLRLSAFNMSEGSAIEVVVGAKVEVEGAIALPARTLSDYAAKLSKERIDINVNTETWTAALKCGSTKSNIKGFNPDEFPEIRHHEPDFKLNAQEFKKVLQTTVYAAANEDTRPVLQALCLRIYRSMIEFAAADGYRLTYNKIEANLDHIVEEAGKFIEVLVPSFALDDLARFIGAEAEVGIGFDEKRNNVTFTLSDVKITTQTFEGKFPEYTAIIPKSHNTCVNVYVSDVLSAIKRAEIFAKDSAYAAKFRVEVPNGPGEPGQLVVAGISVERGDSECSLDAQVEGDPQVFTINSKYITDAVNSFNDQERVLIQLNDSKSPIVVRSERYTPALCVLMPMSTQE